MSDAPRRTDEEREGELVDLIGLTIAKGPEFAKALVNRQALARAVALRDAPEGEA